MLISLSVSFLVSVLAIAVMLRMVRCLPLDHPNHRSLHQRPTPRTGGVGIMLGVVCGWALAWPAALMSTLGLALMLSALSLLDDARGLPVWLRFSLQIVAASLLITGSQPDLPGGIEGAVFAVLALVWMTNLFNFMDGADGLAGGMALFGFSFYALAAWQAGTDAFVTVAGSIAVAAAGFLLFNFDPARIFMGDSGSIPLGFLAAGLGLIGWENSLWPPAFPVLVFSPFIVDASITLIKRLLRRQKLWQAHREHYFQRLILLGFGHRVIALAEYALMLACGLSAMLLLKFSPGLQLAVVVGWLFFYALIAIKIDRAWSKLGVGVSSD